MWLVVGLGNPGKEYASHRHNVGFMATDLLAGAEKTGEFRENFPGTFATGELRGEEVVLLKPQTYMNLSGQSVQPCAAFFKIPAERVLVLHDELDLPFGELRLKVGGGHAGHNGLRSMIASLGTPEFARVRIGIGRPPPGFRGEVADYVLSGFDTMERAELPDILKRAEKTVLDVCARGLVAATKNLNTKPKPTKPKPPPRSPDETGGADSPRGKA